MCLGFTVTFSDMWGQEQEPEAKENGRWAAQGRKRMLEASCIVTLFIS